MPRSVGSAASVPRNGSRLDQLRHVAPHFVDALEEDAVLAKNSPPSGRATVRITSDLRGKRIDQRGGRLVGCFRRRRVDDRDDPVGPLREEPIELLLLLAPGERARQELIAVGVDGDMARDIAEGEDRRDEEARNDQPRIAGRKMHDPRDRGDDDRGGVIFTHGGAVERMVGVACQLGHDALRGKTRILSGVNHPFG